MSILHIDAHLNEILPDNDLVHCINEFCHNLIDLREHSCIYCGVPQRIDETDKKD